MFRFSGVDDTIDKQGGSIAEIGVSVSRRSLPAQIAVSPYLTNTHLIEQL
jgi:hypothetical protein